MELAQPPLQSCWWMFWWVEHFETVEWCNARNNAGWCRESLRLRLMILLLGGGQTVSHRNTQTYVAEKSEKLTAFRFQVSFIASSVLCIYEEYLRMRLGLDVFVSLLLFGELGPSRSLSLPETTRSRSRREVFSTMILAASSLPKATNAVDLKEFVIPSMPLALAEDSQTECDNDCLAERKRIIEDRRAMLRQSRTTTSRQDMFDLSRQRAALYNTTYQGSSCPPGVPCY